MSLTPHAADQAERVRELLDRGYSRQAIAQELSVSGPRVSQIITGTPALRRYRSGTALQRYRTELEQLRQQTQEIARDIREEIRALDEELQSMEVDRLLGLRR